MEDAQRRDLPSVLSVLSVPSITAVAATVFWAVHCVLLVLFAQCKAQITLPSRNLEASSQGRGGVCSSFVSFLHLLMGSRGEGEGE